MGACRGPVPLEEGVQCVGPKCTQMTQEEIKTQVVW